ncbi:MAG: DNA alkylation repair protein [Steroidobacteraceae bacterium]
MAVKTQSQPALTAARVLRDLLARRDVARALVSQRFFKTGPGQYGEGDRFLGLSVPMSRSLAKQYRQLDLVELRKLLGSEWHEARLLALLILVLQYPKADEVGQQAIYKLYMASTARINNWDLVDVSAEHIVGPHLYQRTRQPLLKFARSKDLWQRRIAVLSTFHYIKLGEFAETLRLAEMLLQDEHDLIHKAVGWMLREIGKRDQRAAQSFLDMHAARMPRTMLRYAIERFDPKLRHRYMQLKFVDAPKGTASALPGALVKTVRSRG